MGLVPKSPAAAQVKVALDKQAKALAAAKVAAKAASPARAEGN